jgi:non-specific protein-tyrosine kinase
MEIVGYWRIIVENKFVMAIFVFFGLFGSIFMYRTETSLYRAESQVFVSTPATAIDISALATGSNFSQQRVKSYAQIINSPLTLQGVVDQLKLSISAQELSAKISAVAPPDTVLISITVVDSNPKQAADIANATADQFGKYIRTLENQVGDNQTPIKVSMVRSASIPGSPFSPIRNIYILLGLGFGFGIGLGIAMLRKLFDNSIKNQDDLFGLPLLAAIMFDVTASEKPLISSLSRYAVRTEAFRTLRTNIKYVVPSARAKVIAVSSALPNEGKTTTATNLAISLAQGGNRVVIVEADMRRPNVGKYLEINSKKGGLSHLLQKTGAISLRVIKEQIEKVDVKGLEILCAGTIPSNPSELLGSGNFQDLIDILRRNYEFVIVDCPPLLPVTDAAVVATVTDGVLLVIHAGKTKKPELLGSRAAIESVSSRILGVVLNKIPEQKNSYKYGYRYGYSKGYGKNSSDQTTGTYLPSKDEVYRLEREEFFERIAGKKFKEELRKESAIYDKKK